MSIHYETTDVPHVTEGQLTKGVCVGMKTKSGREVIVFAPDEFEVIGFLAEHFDFTVFGGVPRPAYLVAAQNIKPKETTE